MCLCLLTNQNAPFFPLFCTELPIFALNYLISASYFLKTAFLLANQNREIFVCILLDEVNTTDCHHAGGCDVMHDGGQLGLFLICQRAQECNLL